MPTEQLTLAASDGVVLEAELAGAEAVPRAGVVLCHPHPQFGGTMRSIVISTLFQGLPNAGITALRFNFRGVEGSAGSYDEGRGETLDATAALDELDGRLPDGAPRVMVGWSFGGGIALGVDDARLAGWVGIAPAIRFGTDRAVGADTRPKLVVIGAHDTVITPDAVHSGTASWTNARVEMLPGADHYFVGRTDAVLRLVTEFVASLL